MLDGGDTASNVIREDKYGVVNYDIYYSRIPSVMVFKSIYLILVI